MTVNENEAPMIDIRNVSKWYGSFQVLKNCSTSVRKERLSWSAVRPVPANPPSSRR